MKMIKSPLTILYKHFQNSLSIFKFGTILVTRWVSWSKIKVKNF
jgi:hypothetical protein